MKKMIFLFNPRSGKELIRNYLMGILDIFCKAGYFPAVYVTQGAEDAKEIALRYGEEAELFVCSGGDGTLNGVINGMMGLKKKPCLGYLPSGSTNDFARSMKIPTDLLQAAQVAINGERHRLDVGKFGENQHFVYVAAFGAFTEVSYTTSQDKKNVLGHQAYILESVRHLASLKAHSMKVEWENGEMEGDFIFGMVTNTTSVGGFKGLVPKDVAFDDGLFEALFIRMPRTPADLSNIVSYLFLKEEENEYVYRFKTARLSVTAKEEVSWTLDGEFGGSVKETVIENLSGAIELNCGSKQ